MENVIKGISASKGYALGRVFKLLHHEINITEDLITDTDLELAKFEKAKAKAVETLAMLFEKAVIEVGEEHAEIFNVHLMMLEDLDYNENITSMIELDKCNAPFAVKRTADVFSEMFASMDDEYMKARSADVLDISNRILNNLLDIKDSNLDDVLEPVIIVSEDLFPSDTLALDKSKVLAFVTEKGSKASHTAILARTLAIPAIVDLDGICDKLENDDFIIVDGAKGEIIVNPDKKTIEEFQAKIDEVQVAKERLQKLVGVSAVTKDGVKVELCANIGNPSDLDSVLENDAEGIGLFRSEFIYMDSPDFPTEDYQFEIYKTVLSKMNGKRVIIRTLDLGADKQADYFNIPNEENPAMGYRAIRICLNEKHIFRTQLRALLRASVYGKLAIMFPMIISVKEIIEIRAYIEEIKQELSEEGIAIAKNIELGIMIETPAAAVMTDKLANHVDFFSIGTNDLTQYTLAVDRMNSKISHLYDYADEAVLRLMKMTVDNAHAKKVWVGVCGESGGDLALTETFLAMGIDELSMAPKAILEVREKVLNTAVSELKISF